nr:two-component regulator propeller domain-containing protein [Spirosoma profusum]
MPNNEIVCIYEDKVGNIWFGANGGASRYDGKSF